MPPVRHGDGAVGGIVHIQTRRPRSGPLSGQLDLRAGAWGSREARLRATGGTGPLAASVTLSRQDSDGYRDNDRYDRYGYNDRSDRYGYRNGNPREAVEQCVATAESEASRYSYGRADVTDIRGVDRNHNGLLDRLDRESLAAQRRLTVPFLRNALEKGIGDRG